MKQVNIHDAKTHLSRLVAEAAAGEPFVIARAGRPLVEVRAIAPRPDPSARIGALRPADGRMSAPVKSIGADEINDLFEGRG